MPVVKNKDFEMYFGTTIRNIGLFLSLATAVLVCGRGFKMKTIYNQYLTAVTVFLSGLFVSIAAVLCVTLVEQVSAYDDDVPWTWKIIPKVLLAIICIFFFIITFVMVLKTTPLLKQKKGLHALLRS